MGFFFLIFLLLCVTFYQMCFLGEALLMGMHQTFLQCQFKEIWDLTVSEGLVWWLPRAEKIPINLSTTSCEDCPPSYGWSTDVGLLLLMGTLGLEPTALCCPHHSGGISVSITWSSLFQTKNASDL